MFFGERVGPKNPFWNRITLFFLQTFHVWRVHECRQVGREIKREIFYPKKSSHARTNSKFILRLLAFNRWKGDLTTFASLPLSTYPTFRNAYIIIITTTTVHGDFDASDNCYFMRLVGPICIFYITIASAECNVHNSICPSNPSIHAWLRSKCTATVIADGDLSKSNRRPSLNNKDQRRLNDSNNPEHIAHYPVVRRILCKSPKPPLWMYIHTCSCLRKRTYSRFNTYSAEFSLERRNPNCS